MLNICLKRYCDDLLNEWAYLYTRFSKLSGANMTTSIINLVCENCYEKFQGYLRNIPLAEVEYDAKCPHCMVPNSFSDKAGWIDETEHRSAVPIYRK